MELRHAKAMNTNKLYEFTHTPDFFCTWSFSLFPAEILGLLFLKYQPDLVIVDRGEVLF